MNTTSLFSKFIRLSICLALMLLISIPQITAQEEKKDNGKVFGRIYTGFYYHFSDQVSPRTGFDFSTGILGYTNQLSPKVKATLLYDVTRTTNINSINDTAGNSLDVNYFEGSKYTAFLKMAQIDWQYSKRSTLSVGQLLNEQYLTVQDKWWGFRYVRVSMQEAYRYGMPADFGARITYKWSHAKVSFTLVNGEGPFRHQDDDSKFLYSTNIEYKLYKNFLLKAYSAFEPGRTMFDSNAVSINSFFIGYKTDDIMVGAEFNSISNYRNDANYDVNGTSLYASYRIHPKAKIFYRFDHGYFQTYLVKDYDPSLKQQYHLLGMEYEPTKNFFASLNMRLYNTTEDDFIPAVHCNFGIKF